MACLPMRPRLRADGGADPCGDRVFAIRWPTRTQPSCRAPKACLHGSNPVRFGSVAVLIALIGAIGYGGWSVLQEVQRVQLAPVDRGPVGGGRDRPAWAMLSVGATGAVCAEGRNGCRGCRRPMPLDRLYRPQALDVPVLTSRDGPIAAIDPRRAGALAPVADRCGAGRRAACDRSGAGGGRMMRPGVEAAGRAPVLGAGQFGGWHGAVRKDPRCGRTLCRAAAGRAADAARRQFRVGLFCR